MYAEDELIGARVRSLREREAFDIRAGTHLTRVVVGAGWVHVQASYGALKPFYASVAN